MLQPVIAVLTRPTVTVDEALEILSRAWGIVGGLSPLPSERDRNFLVVAPDGARHVLKLSNLADEPASLELQHLAMARLAVAGVPCPRLVRARDGRTMIGVGQDGGPPFARVLTWLPGRVLADLPAADRDPALLGHLGRVMGQTAIALGELDHPAATRAFQWDPLRAEEVIATHADAVPGNRRALLGAARDRLAMTLWAGLPSLRLSLIHNDANDHNVLVDAGAHEVTGLLDFGDMVHSVTVNEAAVAAAYALLGADHSLDVIASVVRGFNAVHRLSTEEVRAAFELVIARLAVSVVLSAHQARLDPSDPYLTISEAPAWQALEQLLAIEPDRAAERIAEACR